MDSYFFIIFVFLGLTVLVFIPLRLMDFFRGRMRTIFENLNPIQKNIARTGTVGLLLSGCGWLIFFAILWHCPPWKPLCEGAAFSPLLLLIPFYLLVEILLLPITLSQIKKRRDAE